MSTPGRLEATGRREAAEAPSTSHAVTGGRGRAASGLPPLELRAEQDATRSEANALGGVGSNSRYGDSLARQKDNARAEARALQPSTLPLELVSAAGGPVVQAEQPVEVHAYVEIGVTLIRVTGQATAWNSRCVHIRWTGTNPNRRRRGCEPPPSLAPP